MGITITHSLIALIIKQNLVMSLDRAIHCLNYGGLASRRHFTSNELIYHLYQGDRIIQFKQNVQYVIT